MSFQSFRQLWKGSNGYGIRFANGNTLIRASALIDVVFILKLPIQRRPSLEGVTVPETQARPVRIIYDAATGTATQAEHGGGSGYEEGSGARGRSATTFQGLGSPWLGEHRSQVKPAKASKKVSHHHKNSNKPNELESWIQIQNGWLTKLNPHQEDAATISR